MPCSECLRPNGEHAATCPNNPDFYGEPYMKICPICEHAYEEDLMDESVCAACQVLKMTWENAEKYGEQREVDVKINALWAKLFTPTMINEVLQEKALEYKSLFPYMAREDVENFFNDDPSDFADWLVEQKKGGG